MSDQIQPPQEDPTRIKVSLVATDRDLPADVRLPALMFLRTTLTHEEMQSLLGEAKGITDDSLPQTQGRAPASSEQALSALIVELVATCRTPAQRKACIATLRSLLPGDKVQGLVSSLASAANPVALRIKELAENPSALAADVQRDQLIGMRREQIRKVMRTSPLLREAIAVEARTSKPLRDLLSRRQEFYLDREGVYKSQELGFEATRKFTPIFAAMCATESGRNSLRVAIDALNREVRDTLWSNLSANPNYHVPEVVVGSGPSAANYRSTIQTLNPGQAPLVIDAQGYAGGQFAAVVDAVFKLNSRARPYGSISRQNLPGTESPLNTQGPYCAVQESDLTGAAYGDQTNLGLAIEINHFLAGGVACNVALVGWNSFEAPNGKRRIVLALRRTDTGETATMTTDRLVFARGLGAPRCAFRDPAPKDEAAVKRLEENNRILEEEAAIAKSGGFARYRTFAQFLCDMGDRSNPFPLKGIKTVAIIGAGDSGNVTAEALLGYGPDISGAPQELDRVEEIVWLGQNASTKEEFETCNRNRYIPLANEFPRESNPSADSRVIPIAEKALTLAREEDGRLLVTDAKGREYVYDLVIDCSGFERPSVDQSFDPNLIPSFLTIDPARDTTKSLLKLNASGISDAKNTFLQRGWPISEPTILVGDAKNIAYVSYEELKTVSAQNWILWVADGKDGSPVVVSKNGVLSVYRGPMSLVTKELTGPPGDIAATVATFVANDTPASYKELSSLPEKRRLLFSVLPPQAPQGEGVTLEPTVGILNGEKLQLGQRVTGEEVYIVGPETNLTFTDSERARIQANFIAANVVAVFLYSGRITTQAEILAEMGLGVTEDTDAKLESKPRATRTVVTTVSSAPSTTRVRDVNSELFLNPSRVVDRLLGSEVDPQAIVETFVRYAYRDCRPDNSGPLTFSAQISKESGKTKLIIETSYECPRSIKDDPVFIRACYLLLTRPPYRPNAQVNRFDITVPITTRGTVAEFAWNQATYAPQPGTAPRKLPQEKPTEVVPRSVVRFVVDSGSRDLIES
jgi:hypothetical protein